MAGRPREFDEDKVLEAAMGAFWDNGYESTSLADLVAATGLHKGSLYQAFGDKHSLFIRSLKRYLSDVRAQKTAMLAAAESPLSGVRGLFHGFIDMADAEEDPSKGCLAVKAMTEMAPHDPDVQKVMEEHMAIMQRSIQSQLEKAQAAGELGLEKSPEMVAGLLLVFMNGLATWANAGASAAEAHDLLEGQLNALL
ncbi:MAG: TetR/AcrR family transcriptional regulator [Pseudomonadota bacterium]